MVDVGIHIADKGIGDKVQWASVPECFYKYYGIKLIDQKREWIFDYNPYVRRDVEDFFPLKFRRDGEKSQGYSCVYCKEGNWVEPNPPSDNSIKVGSERIPLIIRRLITPSYHYFSHSYGSLLSRYDTINRGLGIKPWEVTSLDFPRAPRLYKYEDPNNVKPNQIAIHIGPSYSQEQVIPNFVIDEIKKRYSNYKIIQVGSTKDNPSPFIDRRGGCMWNMTKIIAESAIFIGVNSGPMNIANCYPHISKKIILTEKGDTGIKRDRFLPLKNHIEAFTWIDYGWQYYTTEERDVGILYSYKKI